MAYLYFKTNLFVLLLMFLAVSCGNPGSSPEKRPAAITIRDTTITEETSFSDLFLDSITVEKFLEDHQVNASRAEQIRSFYKSRNYQFAWFNENGFAQQGKSFWNLHNNYINYSRDSSLFNKKLHGEMRELLEEEAEAKLTKNKAVKIELELTDHFFDYAQYAFAGKIDPDELKWYIPRKKVNAKALLDSLVSKNGEKLDEWEPVNEQYKLVRKELLRLYEIEKNGGWPQIVMQEKSLRLKDSSSLLPAIKERLRLSGDLTQTDTTAFFTSELDEAVKRLQRRMGLKPDGVIGPGTLKEMNVAVSHRIEQLLVNMERMRWMPPQKEGKRLVANIPEYRLHVYEDDKEVFNMKIVVGKAANKTVVFNDQLQHVVFSPYWNIPRSIIRNEILPAMRKNPGYLARNNMEQTGSSDGLPVIRQKPGAGNALGRVKFIFPNSYNIYFHDTPAQSLFNQTERAFSHGCIRLEEPEKLASYLLGDNDYWTSERIRSAMYSGSEKWVNLKEPVPVVISYFTAWVDADGILNYREDIYGHDKELASRLFTR